MDLWKEAGIVEVVGIGSRKDAVLDFCLRSPSISRRLRFWNIVVEDTSKVQLQQRLLGDDVTKTIMEEPVVTRSCSKAVILVAGASYGSDLTTVHDILEAIKIANGFVVTIILKPFRFEGRRRQDEDLDGIVVFILVSPAVIDSSDVDGILRNFRQVAEWEGDIITSVVCEPDMKPGSVATTIFTVGCIRRESSKKDGIFSRLVQRFPFIFNIFKPSSQLDTIQENSSLEKYENVNVSSINGYTEGFQNWPSELQSIFSNGYTEGFQNMKTIFRDHDVAEQNNAGFPQGTYYNESAEGKIMLLNCEWRYRWQ